MTHPHTFIVPLGDRGRLVLPAPLRRHLGLRPGERLILTVEDGGFRVVSAREQAARLRGIYAHLSPGGTVVDEFLAERRREAEREGQQPL